MMIVTCRHALQAQAGAALGEPSRFACCVDERVAMTARMSLASTMTFALCAPALDVVAEGDGMPWCRTCLAGLMAQRSACSLGLDAPAVLMGSSCLPGRRRRQ